MARIGAYDIKSWGCKAEHPYDTSLQGSIAAAPGGPQTHLGSLNITRLRTQRRRVGELAGSNDMLIMLTPLAATHVSSEWAENYHKFPRMSRPSKSYRDATRFQICLVGEEDPAAWVSFQIAQESPENFMFHDRTVDQGQPREVAPTGRAISSFARVAQPPFASSGAA